MSTDPPSALQVTVLGSGTCVPSLRRSSCALLVAVGRQRVLMDCGPGTMHRLLEAGTAVFDITAVCLSHFHPDHSGELGAFLFANKYPDSRQRSRPLTIVGGPGTTNFFERLRALYGRWIDLDAQRLRVLEIDPRRCDQWRMGGLRFQARTVAHNPESLAYRVQTDAGASMVYSGDTDRCPPLADLARKAGLLVCEAALPDELKAPGHLTPSLAGEIAARAHVGRLVLTHFYPQCDEVDVLAQCRRTWNGPVTLAEDLMTLSVV